MCLFSDLFPGLVSYSYCQKFILAHKTLTHTALLVREALAASQTRASRFGQLQSTNLSLLGHHSLGFSTGVGFRVLNKKWDNVRVISHEEYI